MPFPISIRHKLCFTPDVVQDLIACQVACDARETACILSKVLALKKHALFCFPYNWKLYWWEKNIATLLTWQAKCSPQGRWGNHRWVNTTVAHRAAFILPSLTSWTLTIKDIPCYMYAIRSLYFPLVVIFISINLLCSSSTCLPNLFSADNEKLCFALEYKDNEQF